MNDYLKAHKVFVSVTGSITLVALIGSPVGAVQPHRTNWLAWLWSTLSNGASQSAPPGSTTTTAPTTTTVAPTTVAPTTTTTTVPAPTTTTTTPKATIPTGGSAACATDPPTPDGYYANADGRLHGFRLDKRGKYTRFDDPDGDLENDLTGGNEGPAAPAMSEGDGFYGARANVEPNCRGTERCGKVHCNDLIPQA